MADEQRVQGLETALARLEAEVVRQDKKIDETKAWALSELTTAADKVAQLERDVSWNRDGRGHEGGRILNYHAVKNLKPKEWDDSDRSFKVLLKEIKTYLVGLHDDGEDILNQVLKSEDEFDILHFGTDQGRDKVVAALDKELGLTLHSIARGHPKNIIDGMNVKEGFRTLQKLSLFYAPRSEVDEAAALEPLQRPKQSKTVQEFRIALESWDSEVRKFESKFQQIQDIVKVNAIRSMAPDEFYATHLQGKAFKTSAAVRQSIHLVLKDRRLQDVMETASIRKQSGAGGARPMDIGNVDKPPEDKEDKLEKSLKVMEDMCAMIKGTKGGGKGGYGYEGKGQQWNNRWQPWSDQRRSNNKGQEGKKGDSKGRKGQDGGKGGKAPKKKLICWKCGGRGHPAHKCSSPDDMDIGAVGDQQDEEEEEEEEEAEDMACVSEVWEPIQANRRWITTGEKYAAEIRGKEEMPKVNKPKMTRPPGLEPWQEVKTRRWKKKAWEPEYLHLLGEDSDFMGLGSYCNGDALCPISNPSLKSVIKKGKQRFVITLDSGAAANVIPKDMFPDLPLEESEGSRRGQYWISAKGGKIYNLGQKKVEFETDEGNKYVVVFQVADVTKPLLSAFQVTEKGNKVTLKKEKAEIVTKSGKKTALRKEGKVFVMNGWTTTRVFARQVK